MSKEKYYIYHIPKYIHTIGSIGKIGVSKSPKKRVKGQGYTEFEILEIHSCIYKVSDREQELQKEYGYPVDATPYYISVRNLLNNVTSEHRSEANKMRKTYGHSTPYPIVVLIGSKLIGEYESISECGRRLGLDKGSISKVLKGICKQHKGYTFEYIKTS